MKMLPSEARTRPVPQAEQFALNLPETGGSPGWSRARRRAVDLGPLVAGLPPRVHRKRTSGTLASPAPGPYCMVAALMQLLQHERGIHIV
jgi:hypothetical protein